MKKSDEIWIKLMEFGTRMGCHQMESRSFSLKGYQFPVCARCTGVLIGEIIAIILLILTIKINCIILIILLVPMGIDWLIQSISKKESNNHRRLLTGILGGIGLTYLYYYLFMYLIEAISRMF